MALGSVLGCVGQLSFDYIGIGCGMLITILAEYLVAG